MESQPDDSLYETQELGAAAPSVMSQGRISALESGAQYANAQSCFLLHISYALSWQHIWRRCMRRATRSLEEAG